LIQLTVARWIIAASLKWLVHLSSLQQDNHHAQTVFITL
jgi:hypothetical protein